MKKLYSLLILCAFLMLISCQGLNNPGNGNSENDEVFDINKISFSSLCSEDEEDWYQIINTISIDNVHYFMIMSRYAVIVNYDNNKISALSEIDSSEEFNNAYLNGLLDFSDIDTLKDYFKIEETEILGNKVIVLDMPLIGLYEIEDKAIEPEENHFLTLLNNEQKINFDLDLSYNRDYYFEYMNDSELNYFYKKIYKKSNLNNPYKAKIVTDSHFTENYPLCDFDATFDDETNEAFINNILLSIGTDATINTYKKYKYKELMNRYNCYYTGSFYNGLKAIPYQYNEYSSISFYVDFELDTVVLYDQYENTLEKTVLDSFILWNNNGEITDKLKTKLRLNDFKVYLSPIENKVIRISDLGYL